MLPIEQSKQASTHIFQAGRITPARARRADLTSAPLLFWRVYSYLIAYAPAEQPLWIIAVIHGQRSPRVMGALLDARR